MNLENDFFKQSISTNLNIINFLLDLSVQNNKLLLELINKFISSFEIKADVTNTDELNTLLQDLQTILNNSENYKNTLLTFKKTYEQLTNNFDENVFLDANKNFEIEQKNICNVQLKLVNYTANLLNYINKYSSTVSTTNLNNSNNISTSKPNTNIPNSSEGKKEVLIVSEKTGKVILPFSNKKINLSKFKNTSVSRFRETFNLVKNQKDSTISEAFSLAFELMFRYDLHPAVIAACRNVDELDIYISCLDNNLLNEFPFFEIKFEVAPTLSKRSKKSF